MYRLTYFKARNVIGFLSGIGTKTFELDLDKFREKDILVIFGDNASGKSTFLSLVHPWPYPADGRTHFIIEGKEGLLYREYASDDGSVIITKCIYTPKKDGHSTKCYFELHRGADEEPVELNPNGNVTSYYSLLYTYFGINKEFLNFATYNNAVSSIISMSDQERKNSVSSMVPNMGRFEIAYATVNEKYKELRNLIRNVSQKILQYRDEESIRADLKRINRELETFGFQREERLKKLGKIDGRLKELTRGEDVESLMAKYRNCSESAESLDHTCQRLMQELHQLYATLGIEFKPDSVQFKGMESITSRILKYERKLATASAELANHRERMSQYVDEKSRIENKIMELESTLYGVKTQSMDELQDLKASYVSELEEIGYDPSISDALRDMTYDEAVAFSNTVAYIYTMIQALYDEYGNLVTEYFAQASSEDYVEQQVQSIQTLQVRIETNSAKKDAIYRKLIEMEQYRRFQSILDQRPKSCTIDSCPFIANALKWASMANEVDELKKTYESMNLEIEQDKTTVGEYEQRLGLHNTAQTMVLYLKAQEALIQKYFKISLQEVYRSIAEGSWTSTLNMLQLKMTIKMIADRDRYQQLTTQLIPDVDRMIAMVQLYETSQAAIKSQLEQLKQDKKRLKEQYSVTDIHVTATEAMVDRWKDKIALWNRVAELLDQYNSALREQLALTEQIQSSEATIQQIQELKGKKNQVKDDLRELDAMITERFPLQQQLKMDLLSIDKLHVEKLMIEKDFMVIDVIRSIVQPGKGLRKELINIYMFDIYQTANQLLLHTFNGNLYLKEFIITDKEFIIPYVYNGTESPDISLASASQQAAISISISMAILSKIMGNYGIACFDEADGPFSPINRSIFIDILTTQTKYIGLQQCFFITQHQSEYSESDSVGFIAFPGGNTKHIPKDDLIKVG